MTALLVSYCQGKKLGNFQKSMELSSDILSELTAFAKSTVYLNYNS